MPTRKQRDRPIPGFEDEYTGAVGYEKAVHHTHFTVTNKPFSSNGVENGYEWVKIGYGRWKRIRNNKMAKKTKKHPGFKKVQGQIAKKMGVSQERAGAILAARTRKASPAAKRKNPRLKRVKMPKKK